MVSRKSFLLGILMVVLIPGCTSTISERKPEEKIKETVVSEPHGADIYWGKTQSNLEKAGYKTPHSRSISAKALESWCYQVKKEGYYDSEAICSDKTSGNRYVHFELKPLKKFTKEIIQKAVAGDAKYQNELGIFYHDGRGVPQNYKEAVKWFTMAAEQGLAEAQSSLGGMYGMGLGVPQDNIQAHMWSNLAAMNSYEDGKKNREILSNMMSPEEIAEANKLAEKWLETNK